MEKPPQYRDDRMSLAGVFRGRADRYPENPPYNPPELYPEYRLGADADPSNFVYDGVRQLFLLLGYERNTYGTPAWNPLSWLVKPGDVVFIKPNMIAEKHLLRPDWDYVITHGSVIRAIVDYVFIALGGKGRIVIGDAPQTDSDFGAIVRLMGLDKLRDFYSRQAHFPIEIIDLRKEHTPLVDGILVDRIPLPGDPEGSVHVDLGGNSMFAGLDGRGKKYYGAYYDIGETNAHHHAGRHAYALSASPLRSDVFINVPKLKTHKKCGITVNLKSLVGINANKNLLPHYAIGSPAEGGDQFAVSSGLGRWENRIVLAAKKRMRRNGGLVTKLARRFKKSGYALFGSTEEVVRSGNWHGNDTVWRMCLDLNRILFFADRQGTMDRQLARKRYLSVVDGIIGMEGSGPVTGEAKHVGTLIGGSDPVVVDAVCAVLMGFSPFRIPLIAQAFQPHRFPLTAARLHDVEVVSNVDAWHKPLDRFDIHDTLAFKPHFGWADHVELTSDWIQQLTRQESPSA
jgi:uncharacterized protein (DUF362 family)